MTLTFLSPGDPTQRTGGYRWNAAVVESLRRAGHEVDVLALEGVWPTPGLRDAGPLEAIPDGRWVVADGLAWPGLGEHGGRLASRCKVAVVVHSLLGAETGCEAPRELERWERASWGPIHRIIATSRMTARAIDDERVVTLPPGVRPAVRSPGGDGQTILCVATVIPRKGHDVLIDALCQVRQPWRLRCAGEARDPAWAASLPQHPQVTWLGSLDEVALEREYQQADVLAQAAHYEAFGMAIAEALARGIPVVTRPAGIVEHLPAGALEVVETSELHPAIERLLVDEVARRALSDAAWAARTALPTWAAVARGLLEALQ